MRAVLLPVMFMLLAVAAPGNAETEGEKAFEFYERAFREISARSPMFEAELNIKDQNERWDNLSPSYALETRALLERLLAEQASTVSYDALDREGRLSYDLFVSDMNNRIEEIDWRLFDYPVNQMYGWQSRVPSFLISYHRIDTVQDAQAYIKRLEGVDALFDQVIAGLKLGEAKGVIVPRFVFAHVLSDSRNVISGRPFDDSQANSTILEDFANKVAALNLADDVAAPLLEEAQRALLGSVKGGYENLISYLEEQEKRATTDDGVWKFIGGEEYYQYRLHKMTTTDYSAGEIHNIGLQEVARIHDEMRTIMARVGFDGTLNEFFEFMRTSEQFYYPEGEDGAEEYLLRAKEIIDNMRSRLGELFITVPEADIVVRAVEPFREKSAGKAFYQSPAPDGSRPGTYYANLYKMSDMPTYQMEALAFHEGIPGHHMQRAIAIEMKDLPTFRKYARYTAYTEGWGLYSEFIPREMGFYGDPYSDFGRLAMELWRACRLVVDTGIHSKKWTREEAIAYLDENTPNPHGDVVKAIERYIVMPGQATAYKIGMMKILELRESARKRLGSRFEVREYHDVVLRCGPVPLTMLEQIVDDWVKSKLEKIDAGS